jgi:N-acetyl-gamma-glutamyl-phosphate reductase
VNRGAIKAARLVANPGCYPTAAQLPLIPLLQQDLISTEDIIIDAKSGTTGAGRAAKESALFCEVTDGIHAYSVASHRHSPEIEQGLGAAANEDVIVNFTPHLMPMSRGILETIYVKLRPGISADDLKSCLRRNYDGEPFVHVLDGDTVPQTRHLRGSNHCFINIFNDRVRGRAIVISSIDNLMKGASGQAVQNMNIMCGFDETMALNVSPLFP